LCRGHTKRTQPAVLAVLLPPPALLVLILHNH